MKKHITLIFFVLVAASSFSQNIVWETDYPTALNKAHEANKNLIIFFNDGSNPQKESIIRKKIFKSKIFKKLSKSSVGLLVESSQNSEKGRFNSRVISGYNAYKAFPAIKVINLQDGINLSLLKDFDESSIDSFLNNITQILK